MLIRKRDAGLGTLIVALFGLAFAPLALADDMDDVMALIDRYGETEEDLAAQARLIRDDRVMITNIRQTDNAKNMEIQSGIQPHEQVIISSPNRKRDTQCTDGA